MKVVGIERTQPAAFLRRWDRVFFLTGRQGFHGGGYGYGGTSVWEYADPEGSEYEFWADINGEIVG